MNPPRKHHYIPAFYLKQWAGADGKVCVMRKVPSGLSVLRRSPNATGFKVDLYKIDNVPPEQAQQFESVFLTLADNDAYHALQKLIADNRDWTPRYRSAWARFVISLLFRNPENVSDIRGHILHIWEAGKDALREAFLAKDLQGETFEQYFERTHAAVPHVDAAQFLRSLIDNERLGRTLVSMQWDIIELKKTPRTCS